MAKMQKNLQPFTREGEWAARPAFLLRGVLQTASKADVDGMVVDIEPVTYPVVFCSV